ncbi:MAG: hypothetical protein CMH58_07905 [Myxococcales bacterium]|nr:hypothetical protein [Myxococcales bacterium]|tara:strand:+ start:4672 stop:5061 length:390 start_codon:yes stop_codon:yes gene_type:complete
MDAKMILKTFNDHFVEFIDDVQLVFPNNDDIATVRESLVSFRKANPRLVLLTFRQSVIGQYRDEITKGDIKFFIDKDYKQDLGNHGSAQVILEKIDCLREPVRNMTEQDQQKVIKYLQNLTKLCDMYQQ